MFDCETNVGIGLWATALRLNSGAIDRGTSDPRLSVAPTPFLSPLERSLALFLRL